MLNNIDFSNVGNNISKDSNAFKKIQKHSKITTNVVNRDSAVDTQVFNKINNIYSNSNQLNNTSHYYGNPRQHNHSSLDSFLPEFSTLVDRRGLEKFMGHTFGLQSNKNSYSNPVTNANTESPTPINGNVLLKNDTILHAQRKLLDGNPNYTFRQ
jgi:hypothetical protein